MWMTERFGSLEMLVDFLNVRGLHPIQCKIVVARDNQLQQVFHLLYRLDVAGNASGQAVSEAELLPVVEGVHEAEAADAVGAAEAILHEHDGGKRDSDSS